MAQLGFDATTVDPSSGAGALPAGAYEFHAVEADVAPAKSGRGEVLSLVFEVLSGEFAGRKVWERMNIAHDNPIAQKIGQEQLSALCHATGELQVNDTEQLLWKPFTAEIKVETYEKNDGSMGERNTVKKYIFDRNGSPPASKPAPQQQRQAPPANRPAPAAARPTATAATGGARNVPWGKQQVAAQTQSNRTDSLDDDTPL